MLTIDLFCRVVDNYGDIGVCWRLARQLVAEHDCKVRLIVDDLAALHFLAPAIDATLTQQNLLGVEVIAWSVSAMLPSAEIVIEAFACDPPEIYVQAMAARAEKPIWINLEYLSAEAWVDGVHGLPSPHPRLPLTKYFFCPGFTESSGGLIRETSLVSDSLPFKGTRNGCRQWAPRVGMGFSESDEKPIPHPVLTSDKLVTSFLKGEERTKLLAFAYPHAPVHAVATALGAQVTTASRLDEVDPSWTATSPVPQTHFDALLAQFDVLIVRGEDSFVRAQYAALPFLWHIYPTPDDAHFVKLDAWLHRYCEDLEADNATALRDAHHAFNRGDADAHSYRQFAAHLPMLGQHARHWRDTLFAQTDLATRLLDFVTQISAQKVS